MKNFILAFLNTINLFASGIYKFVRDNVIPCISFVNAIKALLDQDMTVENFSATEFLKGKLAVYGKLLQILMAAFVDSVLKLLSNQKDLFKDKKYENIIIAFANYVKTLEKHQRNMLYLKLASMMLIFIAGTNKIDLSSSHADTLIQLTYSNPALKKQIN